MPRWITLLFTRENWSKFSSCFRWWRRTWTSSSSSSLPAWWGSPGGCRRRPRGLRLHHRGRRGGSRPKKEKGNEKKILLSFLRPSENLRYNLTYSRINSSRCCSSCLRNWILYTLIFFTRLLECLILGLVTTTAGVGALCLGYPLWRSCALSSPPRISLCSRIL